jgi:hypothetical protein
MKSLSLCCCLVLSACTDDLTLGETSQGIASPGMDDEGGSCPEWGCGSNSPVIGFHELSATEANPQGWRLVHFQKLIDGTWRNYTPSVTNGYLTAKYRYIYPPTTAWSHYDLIGMRFEVVNSRGTTIYITISDIGRVYYWAHPNGNRLTQTYHLVWKYEGETTHGRNVCGAGAGSSSDGIPAYQALLFENDRIDADALSVYAEEPGWFNIACKGHALAKQHLLGHTKASATVLGILPLPSLDERTANLKMITGDYCGIGAPFTVPGQPLNWRDENNWYSDIPASYTAYQIEARWTANGASCLNIPRIDFSSTTLGDATFPNGVESLLSPTATPVWCTPEHPRPPPCYGGVDEMQGAHVISVNPVN